MVAGVLQEAGEGAQRLRKEGSDRLHVLQLDVTCPDQLSAAARRLPQLLPQGGYSADHCLHRISFYFFIYFFFQRALGGDHSLLSRTCTIISILGCCLLWSNWRSMILPNCDDLFCSIVWRNQSSLNTTLLHPCLSLPLQEHCGAW